MRRSLFVFVALAVSAGASALIAGARAKVPSHTMDSAAVLAEARTRDLDIALYERRAAEDPESSADRGRLAGLYLQRGRETGSFADVQRAESLAVRALNLRESHNDEVFSVLAAARLALHDFSGALEAARSLVNRDPAEPYRRAVLGEVLLELGRYDEAAVIFRALERETSRLPVATRLARWYELTGRIGHARNVMRYALRRIVQEGRATREQEAWYHLRLGEIELKMGAVETAESLFVSGLARSPDDHRLLGARAVAAARRQDWLAAIDAGERAIAVHVDPATLGIVSEAYAALGDWAQSVSYARAMRASALAQPGPIHRAWGLFLLDHGDEAETVLARAREELETRRDVYGYDLVAWALHTLGRDDEAWPNVTRALAQGTEDALLWYHAAQVAQARGDSEAAQRFASRAVGINARFAERTQASPEARGQRLEARGPEARGPMISELLAYAELGFRHITDLQGADHILFLLVLAAIYRLRDWRAAIWVVSAFTVGHSITLALAVTGAMRLPTPLIEFLIPVTIIATSVENVRARGSGRPGASRVVLAGVFGLVHGAGFANYLRSLFVERIAVPLLGFNLGIEMGQLVVLVAAFCCFALIDRALSLAPRGGAAKSGWSPAGLRAVAVSLVVAVVAARWAAERYPW